MNPSNNQRGGDFETVKCLHCSPDGISATPPVRTCTCQCHVQPPSQPNKEAKTKLPFNYSLRAFLCSLFWGGNYKHWLEVAQRVYREEQP